MHKQFGFRDPGYGPLPCILPKPFGHCETSRRPAWAVRNGNAKKPHQMGLNAVWKHLFLDLTMLPYHLTIFPIIYIYAYYIFYVCCQYLPVVTNSVVRTLPISLHRHRTAFLEEALNTVWGAKIKSPELAENTGHVWPSLSDLKQLLFRYPKTKGNKSNTFWIIQLASFALLTDWHF